MAFCGQSLCRRGQLNFVRATRDHAVAWLDTGAHANETRISRSHIDEPPSEPLAAQFARTRTAGRLPSAPPPAARRRFVAFGPCTGQPYRSGRQAAGRFGSPPQSEAGARASSGQSRRHRARDRVSARWHLPVLESRMRSPSGCVQWPLHSAAPAPATRPGRSVLCGRAACPPCTTRPGPRTPRQHAPRLVRASMNAFPDAVPPPLRNTSSR